MREGFANVPNRSPLLSHILFREGLLTESQTEKALRVWFVQRKESKTLPFGEVVVQLGFATYSQLMPYLQLQRVLAAPPGPTRRLGVMVIENGLVRPSELVQALVIHQATGKKLGEVLVDEGYLRRPQLAHLLRLQGRKFTNRLLPPGEIPAVSSFPRMPEKPHYRGD